MTKRGSTKPGPSPAFRRLLQGEISSKEYTEQVKRDVSKKISTPVSDKSSAAA